MADPQIGDLYQRYVEAESRFRTAFEEWSRTYKDDELVLDELKKARAETDAAWAAVEAAIPIHRTHPPR